MSTPEFQDLIRELDENEPQRVCLVPSSDWKASLLMHGWQPDEVWIVGREAGSSISILRGRDFIRDLTIVGLSLGDEGARALAELGGLTSLDLSGNGIGDEGARALAELGGLTSLDLSHNGIGDEGARALAELGGLTSLHLSHNSIGPEGARALAELGGLTSLDLSLNGIGDEGARALAELGGLTSLNLRGNSIGDEGARALLERLSQPSSSIQMLWLRDNEISFLPKDLLGSPDAQAILAAYRRYVASEGQTEPLGEAKLLVVGNEAVGKTSLIRYLIEGKPCDPNEPETPGIRTHEKITTTTWSTVEQGPRLNVWDFGGQEMMHGTHKYFLTERSLYLLVLEDRRKDDRSVYDWLRTIANRGGESPVIIVINKSDEDQGDETRRHLQLDDTRLRADFPVVDILRTSCAPGEHARRTIDRLKARVVETLNDHPHLKHVRDPIAPQWRRIKDAISDRAHEEKILRYDDFRILCERTEGIDDEDEQRALLRLLHDLGIVIAHGLRRDATAIARELSLLDPNWLTGAIYTVLNHRRVGEQGGEFSLDDLPGILDPKDYSPERYPFVLEMMQHPDVGLCFPLPHTNGRRFLIPEALPKDSPNYDHWPSDALRFRYEYEHLPAGLLPSFIVKAHPNLAKGATRWRTGAVLSVAGCSVLVVADLDRHRVDVRVAGPKGRRRSALNIVTTDLEHVHRRNPEAKPKAVVPLPDQPEVYVSYEHLLRLEEDEGIEHSFRPDGASRKEKYSVGELLSGVRQDPRPRREHDFFPPVMRIDTLVFMPNADGPVIGGTMSKSDYRTTIENTGQMQSVATGKSTATTTNSTQATSTAPIEAADQIERDQFEADVAEILGMLVAAKEELEADYEAVRVALRRLNLVEVEQAEALASVRAKLDEALRPNDKTVLRRLADARGAIATNLVSSGIWQYAIEPVITAIG